MNPWLLFCLGIGIGTLSTLCVSLILASRKRKSQDAILAQSQAQLDLLSQQHTQLQQDHTRQAEHIREFQAQALDMTTKITRYEVEQAQYQRQLDARAADLDALQKQSQYEFQRLANEILDKSASRLQQTQQTQMGQLLDPLKERLRHFEQKVEQTYHQETRERSALQEQIKTLAELNRQMSTDAQQLVQALKGDTKIQGNWGELILTRLLESSGLREGSEFTLQGKDLNLTDVNGQRFQPDVVIQLPESRHLIIDSKVSLVAFERYSSASDLEEQARQMSMHLKSIETHIRQLSDKHYAALQGVNAPDFVMLFIPIEPAFHAAIQAKGDLFQFAWDRKIVLVSPTTLLATLKTVASIWKLEHQNQHAMEIARVGGALYDKFVGFVEDLEKIGKRIDGTAAAYEQARSKLMHGRGSLASQAEKLRLLGVKHKKQLSEDAMNQAQLPDQQEKA
ncbi:DNA recombination protein RmuC [Pontibacter sp. G13]|uniref:DNA recombination protein RmuC n=1 Tax=Pontibacter sp. G13 TaxID=3074898 RepID=UPI00288A061A|nr:DNA recombination protein RmuC [Pontibacter sp. G13]WNJ21091.1 DNA recombination protein RmuC [Pontibacter sp. G13]